MKSSTPSKLQIFGTFGPKCHSTEDLLLMLQAGMRGIRLNTNHKKLAEAKKWIENFQEACDELGVKGELLIDLKGRALRSGDLKNPLFLERGRFYNPRILQLDLNDDENLQEGDHLLMDDGRIEARIKNGRLMVIRGGSLEAHKNINLINREYQRLSLDPQDRKQLLEAREYGVSSIMVPFVQDAQDLQIVHEFLKAHDLSYRIYAKIENRKGIENLEEILKWCDEIVIARGDLANSTGLLNIGWISNLIASICKTHDKPYMIVTQMMHSMIEHPAATRAEVNDVFQAVFQGASSIMLTNETAAGNHSVKAMQDFCAIAFKALQYRSLGDKDLSCDQILSAMGLEKQEQS